ncbi:MAG: hypothetical protein ACYC6A_10360 [Armatimonadota bacterium]
MWMVKPFDAGVLNIGIGAMLLLASVTIAVGAFQPVPSPFLMFLCSLPETSRRYAIALCILVGLAEILLGSLAFVLSRLWAPWLGIVYLALPFVAILLIVIFAWLHYRRALRTLEARLEHEAVKEA